MYIYNIYIYIYIHKFCYIFHSQLMRNMSTLIILDKMQEIKMQ